MTDRVTAWLFTDPGCPWGYSFRPAQARLRWRFGGQIVWRPVMIGLSESPEHYEERGFTAASMASGSRRIVERFGMPYGALLKPRLAATSPACRAVVATRLLDPAREDEALRALQTMNFTTAGMLDEPDDLRTALAAVPGLDADAVIGRLGDAEVRDAYEADRRRARSVEDSPSHAQGRSAEADGSARYTAPTVIFERREGGRAEVGGFQPFAAYDTALANLDPTLVRRPPPGDPAEALEALPGPLSTAEMAAIMAPSDLDPLEPAAVEERLYELAAAGVAEHLPAGGDALWRLAGSGAAERPRATAETGVAA